MSFGKWLSFCLRLSDLTHWGRVTHICVSTLTIIGSHNGLSPGRRQAIIWTNAGILLVRPLGTNFREMLIEIRIFSFMKMRLKVSSAKWRPFRPGLKVLTIRKRYHYLYLNDVPDAHPTALFHGCVIVINTMPYSCRQYCYLSAMHYRALLVYCITHIIEVCLDQLKQYTYIYTHGILLKKDCSIYKSHSLTKGLHTGLY